MSSDNDSGSRGGAPREQEDAGDEAPPPRKRSNPSSSSMMNYSNPITPLSSLEDVQLLLSNLKRDPIQTLSDLCKGRDSRQVVFSYEPEEKEKKKQGGGEEEGKREDQHDRKKEVSKWRPEDQVPILEAIVDALELLCSSSEIAGQIDLQIGELLPLYTPSMMNVWGRLAKAVSATSSEQEFHLGLRIYPRGNLFRDEIFPLSRFLEAMQGLSSLRISQVGPCAQYDFQKQCSFTRCQQLCLEGVSLSLGLRSLPCGMFKNLRKLSIGENVYDGFYAMKHFLKSVEGMDRLESLSLRFNGELLSAVKLDIIGKPSLKELQLQTLSMRDTEAEVLISLCSHLEKLTLKSIWCSSKGWIKLLEGIAECSHLKFLRIDNMEFADTVPLSKERAQEVVKRVLMIGERCLLLQNSDVSASDLDMISSEAMSRMREALDHYATLNKAGRKLIVENTLPQPASLIPHLLLHSQGAFPNLGWWPYKPIDGLYYLIRNQLGLQSIMAEHVTRASFGSVLEAGAEEGIISKDQWVALMELRRKRQRLN